MTSCVLKSQRLNLSVLKILNPEPSQVRDDLKNLLENSGAFMTHAPVLVAFSEGPLEESKATEIMSVVRDANLVPVGVAGVTEELARKIQLTVLDVAEKPRETREPVKQVGAKRLDRPVRSGQQIYVRDGDLVVHGAVGVGAEIAADGSIHVYGPLRGRAIAGASGDRSARIYAHEFHAELVAIAGEYKVIDDPQDTLLGKAICARLDDDTLRIEPV